MEILTDMYNQAKLEKVIPKAWKKCQLCTIRYITK